MADGLDDIEEGDRILFADKKLPLTVEETGEERIFVTGPHGGEYVVFRSPDDGTLLYAARGNRRYASLAENLRTVGEWKKMDSGAWKHSETDAVIRIVENDAGFWTIETEGFEADLDLPAYGFTNRETAEDEAQSLIEDHPEG